VTKKPTGWNSNTPIYQDTQARRKQEIADLVKEANDPQTTVERKVQINLVLNDKRGQLDQAE
jgi:hypothetical protein